MDPRRTLRQDYGRRGGAYGSARAIAPTAVPSLSTGQSFYTVESLQGATVVPPPQPAPPPPRLLPPEPYPYDAHPRLARRLDPAERADLGGPRHHPPRSPTLRRKTMMLPPPDWSFPRCREMHRRRPPFMLESRVPGVFPRPRDALPPRGDGWGPYSDTRPHWPGHGLDQSGSFQRFNARKPSQKTVKPVAQATSSDKAAANERPSADKHNLGHRKGHKKKVEIRQQGEETAEKIVESKEDAIDVTVAEKGAKLKDKMAKIAPKDEDKSDPKDNAGAPQPFTAIASKKRGVKGVVTQPTKKSCKSAPMQNDTPKSKDESKKAEATCTEVMPDADTRSADDAASLQKSADSKREQFIMLPAVEHDKKGKFKGVEADGKEDADLANGTAGQSAEVQ